MPALFDMLCELYHHNYMHYFFKCFTVGRLPHEVCTSEVSVQASMSIRHVNNTLHTSWFFSCILKRESPIPFASECSLLHNMFVTSGFHFKILKISSVGQPFQLYCVSVMQVQSVIFSHTYNVLLAALNKPNVPDEGHLAASSSINHSLRHFNRVIIHPFCQWLGDS